LEDFREMEESGSSRDEGALLSTDFVHDRVECLLQIIQAIFLRNMHPQQ
jgi:hypothetical protein